MLKLWVWHDVLRDYSAGIAFALAETEDQAWEELKRYNWDHWRMIAGGPYDDGSGVEEPTRPVCYDRPIAFSKCGGA